MQPFPRRLGGVRFLWLANSTSICRRTATICAPTHPCYPTGHGTVGGACITAIKFFFDGSQRIRPLLLARRLRCHVCRLYRKYEEDRWFWQCPMPECVHWNDPLRPAIQ